jgi:hypothetical protein
MGVVFRRRPRLLVVGDEGTSGDETIVVVVAFSGGG